MDVSEEIVRPPTFEDFFYAKIDRLSLSTHLRQNERQTAESYQTKLRDYLNSTRHSRRKRAALKLLKELWVYRHSKERTYPIFESFFKFEPMLFRDPSYRDHFFHQINVFVIGHYLINKLLHNQRIYNVFDFAGDINFTWLLASTFHDVGYPIQKVSAWMTDFFQDFIGARPLYQVSLDTMLTQNFYDYVRHLATFHYAREKGMELPGFGVGSQFTDWRLYDQLLVGLKNKNHGVLSALLLMHRILTQESFARSQEYLIADFPKQICTAAHAIGLHHLKATKEKVRFTVNPFGALLILCDEIQDEGRPSAKPMPFTRIVDIDVEFDGNRPTVKCLLEIPNRQVKEQKSKLRDRITMDQFFTLQLLDTRDQSVIATIN